MGALRSIALAILGISAFTFIALFGRLPILRRTPIGFLHKTIWVYIPNGISYVDSLLLGGRVSYCWSRSGSYILQENHPLVLIFFLTLQVAGEYLFIPSAWSRITTVHRFLVPVAAILPYIFLYACVVTKSFITPENHATELARYPYDRVIFNPNRTCKTCQFLKPARSKHCSFCKACVSRHDHHCVWLMNCVGRNNYRYFLSLLLSLSVMLTYGTCLGYVVLCQTWERLVPVRSSLRSKKQSWTTFLNIWSVVIATDPRIGVTFLLALMTAPLAMAFLVYHTYLVWAGMTTNESSKWSDVKEDVSDGLLFQSTRDEIYGDPAPDEAQKSNPPWPVGSDQVLALTDGEEPTHGGMIPPDSDDAPECSDSEDGTIDTRWTRVRSMRDIDNIYDLGFWNNIREIFQLGIRQ